MAKKNKFNAQQEMLNLQAAQLAAQIAQNAAQQEFQRMRFTELEKPQFAHLSQMDKEQLAFQKASQAWTESFQKATLTGQWNGTDTAEERWRKIEQAMNEAALTGTYNGQQTVAEQQRRFANALSEAGITGIYNGQETAAERAAKFERAVAEAGLTGTYGGQQTTAWQAQQAGLTGYFQGQETLARQQMQNENALALMNLQASLRGPRNAFQYAQALATTPGGLADSVQAMAGRAQIPGFQGYSAPLQAASLRGLYGDIMGSQPEGIITAIPGQLSNGVPGIPTYNPNNPNPVASPMAVGVPAGAMPVYNPVAASALTAGVPDGGRGAIDYASRGTGNIGMGLPDMLAQSSKANMEAMSPFSPSYEGTQAPTNMYNYQPTGDGRYYSYPPGMAAPPEAFQVSSAAPMNFNEIDEFLKQMPMGSQISADYWNQQPQYMKDFMLSGYEARGEDPGLVQDAYRMSLPKYTGARVGSFI